MCDFDLCPQPFDSIHRLALQTPTNACMSSADGCVAEYSTDTPSADGGALEGAVMVGGSLGDRGSLPPTHPEENLTPMDERNRALELAKYFVASQTVPASQGAIGDDEVAAAPSAPAADTTLTALAQLGTFKLACDRAFISLINSTHQYIIGEATQSTSLLDNALRPDDGLCLGVRALELAFGVCPQTIQVFTSDDRTISTSNVHADRTRYVIKDFTADSQFKNRPYVTGWPHMRSYAEVPLKSASGYVVGSYCVVDTRPRVFDDSEIQILDSVGVTIMNHLELLKSQLEFHRVQRLVRSIGSYAAGYSGFHEHQTRLPLGTSILSSSPRPVNGKKSLPLRLTRGDSDRALERPATPRVNTEETAASPSDTSLGIAVSSDTDATGPESKPDYSDGDDVGGRQSPAEPPVPDEKAGSSDGVSMPDHSNNSSEAHGGTTFSRAASAAVSRASHLIRQSMDLAVVIFVVCHIASSLNPTQLTLQLLETARAECRCSWLVCQCQHYTRLGSGRSELCGDRSLGRRWQRERHWRCNRRRRFHSQSQFAREVAREISLWSRFLV
jgi:hypothetical protein